MRKQIRWFFIIAFLVSIVIAGAAYWRYRDQAQVIYREHLDDIVLEVDGTSYPLSDLAFYIAWKEKEVEDQARVYNPKNTNQYWNMHTEGTFVKLKAKQSAIDLAVHDIIFYQLALDQKISLTEEEKAYAKNKAEDFWTDLTEEQQKLLGVSKKDITQTLLQMAYAQKEQQELAGKKGADYADYELDGKKYSQLLAEHSVKIREKLWDKIDFGNVTLSH